MTIIIIKKIIGRYIMRILLVSEFFPPKIMGGGEVNLHLLARALAKKAEVHVVTSGHQNLKRLETVDGIMIHRCLNTAEDVKSIRDNLKRSIFFPKSVFSAVTKLCSSIQPDIIHLLGTSIVAAEKLRRLNIPLVATIESYPALCPKGDRLYNGEKECKLVCSFSKFVVCQSNSSEIGKMRNTFFLKYNPFFHAYLYNYFLNLRNSLGYCHLISISSYVQKVLLQHGHHSVVIPNMVETNKFNLQPRKLNLQPGAENKTNKPTVLYVGSLLKSKGPMLLLKAIKGLDCQCRIYGDGILKKELQDFIAKNNLNASIYGPVPPREIPEIYANSDLIVFPSSWPEPFGRIPLEAMAAGKPVIASNTGGISELITPETGLLFEANNVGDLRNKIKSILNDQEKRKSLSASGPKMALKYSGDKITGLLIREYNRVIKNNQLSLIYPISSHRMKEFFLINLAATLFITRS